MNLEEHMKRRYELRSAKRALEAEEKTLRETILSQIGESKFIVAGDMCAILKERTQNKVDNEGIKNLLGDKYQEFVSKSTTQVLEIINNASEKAA